jgi:hypothetical protein
MSLTFVLARSKVLTRSNILISTATFYLSSIFSESLYWTATKILNFRETSPFSLSSNCLESALFDKSVIRQSEEFDSSGSLSGTGTLNVTEEFSETNDLSGMILWEGEEEVVKIKHLPMWGYIAAIGLLIITGMSFWVRSASLEANRMSPKVLPQSESSDDLSAS